jgi:hypothetical protein
MQGGMEQAFARRNQVHFPRRFERRAMVEANTRRFFPHKTGPSAKQVDNHGTEPHR